MYSVERYILTALYYLYSVVVSSNEAISNTSTITLPTYTTALVRGAATDTMTNKTLTSPVISTISNSGTITIPTGTDTLVGCATTDMLTNKTITATGTGNNIQAVFVAEVKRLADSYLAHIQECQKAY